MPPIISAIIAAQLLLWGGFFIGAGSWWGVFLCFIGSLILGVTVAVAEES